MENTTNSIKDWEIEQRKWFVNHKPWETVDEIPEMPVLPIDILREHYWPEYYRMGAIHKADLISGKMYLGQCRNASVAEWNGNEFVYERNKFGYTYGEKINHFEDDDGFDVFIPWKMLCDKTTNDEQ